MRSQHALSCCEHTIPQRNLAVNKVRREKFVDSKIGGEYNCNQGGDDVNEQATRLKAVRTALGLSRDKFCEKLGVSSGVVANIELGRVEAKQPFLKLVCDVYRVNQTWMDTGEGDMFPPKTMEDTLNELFDEVAGEREDSFRKQVFLGMAQLDAKDWAVIAQLVRKMLGKDTEEK